MFFHIFFKKLCMSYKSDLTLTCVSRRKEEAASDKRNIMFGRVRHWVTY